MANYCYLISPTKELQPCLWCFSCCLCLCLGLSFSQSSLSLSLSPPPSLLSVSPSERPTFQHFQWCATEICFQGNLGTKYSRGGFSLCVLCLHFSYLCVCVCLHRQWGVKKKYKKIMFVTRKLRWIPLYIIINQTFVFIIIIFGV